MPGWELILILVGAALVAVLALFIGVPFIIRHGIPLKTYFSLTQEGITLVEKLIAPMLPPQDQKIMQAIVKYADLAVKYAEQMYISGQLSASERKQSAVNFVVNAMKDAGITLTPTEVTFVSDVIEAMVFLLPKTNIVTPVASGTSNAVNIGWAEI